MESILDKDLDKYEDLDKYDNIAIYEMKETKRLLIKEYEVNPDSADHMAWVRLMDNRFNANTAEIALSIMVVDNASEELAYREARKFQIRQGLFRVIENIAQDLVNKRVNEGVRTSLEEIYQDARRIQVQSLRRMYMGFKSLPLGEPVVFPGKLNHVDCTKKLPEG